LCTITTHLRISIFCSFFSLFLLKNSRQAAKNSSQELRLPERFLQTYIQRNKEEERRERERYKDGIQQQEAQVKPERW
jgi:hypothetical protein